MLRLLAPFLPYVTEEVWSWWQEGSIHVAPWPEGHDGLEVDADPALLDAVAAALVGIRGAKSQAKVSMRAPLARVEVTGPPALVEAASAAAADLRRAGHVQGDLVFTAADRTPPRSPWPPSRREPGPIRLRSDRANRPRALLADERGAACG